MRLWKAALAAVLCCAMPAFAFGQGAVLQSQTVTPGHPAAWVANGVIADGISPTVGPLLSTLGIQSSSGCSLFANSGPITVGYEQFCLGVSPTGPATLSVLGVGGQANEPLNLNVPGGLIAPGWTTAGRPSAPAAGMFGFNSTIGNMDVYNGSAWVSPVPSVCSQFGIGATNCPAGNYVPVSAYAIGAKCDWNGTTGTDDSAAFNAATAAPIEIVLPSNAACYVANPWVITSPNVTVTGGGPGVSTIVGASNVAVVIQVGNGAGDVVNPATLQGFSVTRAGSATPPAGSIGIELNSFNYVTARSVDVRRSDIGWDITGPSGTELSIAAWLDDISASNVTTAWARVTNAADVHFIDPQFGRNGGEVYDYPCGVILAGAENGTEILGGALIPRTPTDNHVAIFCYEGATNDGDGIWAQAINTENYSTVVSSDAATPAVSQMMVTGGRFGGVVSQNFFALNAATTLKTFHMTGGTIGHPVTIPASANVYWSGFDGTAFGSAVSVTGSASTGSGIASDFYITGGTLLHGSLTLGGTFASLTVSANNIGTFADTSVCSTSANCKNLHVSGTWTPTLTFGGGNTGMNLTGSSGNWEINGQQITADFLLDVVAKGTSTGVAVVGGIPFNYRNAFGGCVVTSMSGFASLVGAIMCPPNAGAKTFNLKQEGAANDTSLQDVNFTDGTILTARVLGAVQ